MAGLGTFFGRQCLENRRARLIFRQEYVTGQLDSKTIAGRTDNNVIFSLRNPRFPSSSTAALSAA
jgi:hypothetical protein